LFIIVQIYIIRREEKYLDRAFAEEYRLYKKKVRRWI
jgi:protein-S-isoprenylcysteine O-methyltransferase Ste14